MIIVFNISNIVFLIMTDTKKNIFYAKVLQFTFSPKYLTFRLYVTF